MRFVKMQGAGNDYVYVNGFCETISNPEDLARKVSDRHFGIGSDGLVLILPSETCDFRMRMFNADGSEAEMCGNASRCVGKYVYDNKMTEKREITLETKAGVRRLELIIKERKVDKVRVDMGTPEWSPNRIPVLKNGKEIINEPISVCGNSFRISCVSMGNPHTVLFLDSFEKKNLHSIGYMIENHTLFPERTNVEFVVIDDRANLSMRVWKRGVGETYACGTGACASLVTAVKNELADRKATLHLLGGDLEIEWSEKNEHVYMTGSAVTVFDGEYYIW